MEPHAAGAAGRLGKHAAPALARLVNSRPLRNPARLAGIYLDILQGRGSGTGWDLAGEVSAAVPFLAGVADPVIFDVGANVGEWTLGMWRACGRGRYFAYEPQDACLPQLKSLPVPNLTVVRSAMSDRAGTLKLYSDVAGSGLASFYERLDTYLPRQTRVDAVPVTTVDEELKARGLGRVDFMKVDVEGAELRVLSGAADALSRQAVRSLAFEFGSANIASRVFFRDCWDLMTGHGYRLWRIAPGGVLVPLRSYREELEHFRGVSNFVASAACGDGPHRPGIRAPR